MLNAILVPVELYKIHNIHVFYESQCRLQKMCLISKVDCVMQEISDLACSTSPGDCLNIKILSCQYSRFPIIKIRQYHDGLNFIVGIPITLTIAFILIQGPDYPSPIHPGPHMNAWLPWNNPFIIFLMKQTLPLLSRLLLEPDGGSIKRRSKQEDFQGWMHNMQSCNMQCKCGSIVTVISFLPNTTDTSFLIS